MRKLRLREITKHAEGHISCKWQDWVGRTFRSVGSPTIHGKPTPGSVLQTEPLLSSLPSRPLLYLFPGVRASQLLPAITGPCPLFFLPKPQQKVLSLFIRHFIQHTAWTAWHFVRNFISFWLSLTQLWSEENRNCKNTDKFSGCRFVTLRMPPARLGRLHTWHQAWLPFLPAPGSHLLGHILSPVLRRGFPNMHSTWWS